MADYIGYGIGTKIGTEAPTTDIDQLRLIIGDTDESDYLFTDDELNYFLDTYGTVLLAAANACQSLSIRFSRIATKSMGDLSISYSGIAEAYARRASELRDAAMESEGGMDTINIPSTPLKKVKDIDGIPSRMLPSDIRVQKWSNLDLEE